MTTSAHSRKSALRAATALLVLAAGVFVSPLFLRQSWAQQQNTCSVTCPSGSTCSASGNCTCTCSAFLKIAVCTCSNSPEPPPSEG